MTPITVLTIILDTTLDLHSGDVMDSCAKEEIYVALDSFLSKHRL
jgi:hypothetical protein